MVFCCKKSIHISDSNTLQPIIVVVEEKDIVDFDIDSNWNLMTVSLANGSLVIYDMDALQKRSVSSHALATAKY